MYCVRSIIASAFLLLVTTSLCSGETHAPETGPAAGGLRLRLEVQPKPENSMDGYKVKLDLLNTTDKPIVLKANWLGDHQKGDFKEYFEASASIETYPPIGRWQGQTVELRRTLPQPEYRIAAGGMLSCEWESKGRKLKNLVTCPSIVENPTFPVDGLYSVHAVAAIHTGKDTFILRSNEQLVPVGGSVEMPKHALARVRSVDFDSRRVVLNIGRLQKVHVGDRFLIRTGMHDFWRLDMDRVDDLESSGTITPSDVRGNEQKDAKPRLPRIGSEARLVTEYLYGTTTPDMREKVASTPEKKAVN